MSATMPVVEGVRHRFVNVGDLTMHYAEAGDGEPMVLLHGWPQHWYMWRHQIADLARRYRVIVPDLRGFGWSDAPPDGYDKEQLATDIIGLLDAIGVSRFRLIGHDWGGLVGFLICLRLPERVIRFMALNIPHPFQRVDDRLISLWRFWYQFVISTPWLGYTVIRRTGFVEFIIKLWAARKVWSKAELQIYSDVLRQPMRANASVQIYRTFALSEFLPVALGRYNKFRLHTPTLIMFGIPDVALSTGWLKGYENFADDLTIEYVPDCGHLIVDEQPRLVSERAKTFFDAQQLVSTERQQPLSDSAAE